MYSELGVERLRSGEWLRVGVVEGPDADWLPRLVPFLGHKPDQYRHHIRCALESQLDNLETRFYVGAVDDRLISQVMVVGDCRVGILGHVYTLPGERRKGACAAIMRHQMDHCRQLGYQALCLGTGFDTPPYHIYRSFGFRGVAPGNGCMRWFASSAAEAALLAPGPTDVRDGRWMDWGYVYLLSLRSVLPGEELPRSVTLGVKAQSSAEGSFLRFQIRRDREAGAQAKALVSGAGVTVGWATLAPDIGWFRDHWLLDMDAYPSFHSSLPELLAAFDWPDAKVVAYSTPPEGPKARALRSAGFSPRGLLDEWLAVGGHETRLIVWYRG